MRIDSHHHFWNYSAEQYPWIKANMEALRRDFTPLDLKHEIQQVGLDGVVSVQARQSIEETEWLLALAAEYDFILGVVGWLPLAADDMRCQIGRWSRFPKLKAVRHVVQDEPDDAFLLSEDFNRGVEQLDGYDLVYDILIFARQLPNTLVFVDRHPQQRFVLDHVAKPAIRARRFDQQWAKDLCELAKRAHVTCKFSALVTEVRDEQWSVETLRPYWDAALEAFGPERLMFGSDWPVCLLRSDYARWVAAVEQLSAGLSLSEQQALWGETAQRVYRL
ncbi:MAG: amidohydrolase family protein [Pirellulaceae bacterium]|jgi:L-fuconolactonase|nr:amidohydrolase family protein [Pirellulaceae bacterium]